MGKQPIHALTNAQTCEVAKSRLVRGYGHARRLHRMVVREGRFDPESVGLGHSASKAWNDGFSFELPEVVAIHSDEAAHGTTSKAILRSADGLEVETVSIPMGRGRYTLCVSSQVGCKMGCRFCETGRMGLLRHLKAHEIVAQVLVARHRLGWAVRNIVFMGMGEALDNPDQVIQALRVLNDPAGMAIAQERMTVCTVGGVRGIDRLRREGMSRLNLSVSLNAANDGLRSEIMPVNRRDDLASLQAALIAYRPRRNFALGVNYCLLPGVNDTRQHVREIAAFCDPLGRVLVNVIPYNPGSAPMTRAPSDGEIDTFIGWLRAEGIPVRQRITKGRSVMAACGQLGDPSARARRRLSTVASR